VTRTQVHANAVASLCDTEAANLHFQHCMPAVEIDSARMSEFVGPIFQICRVNPPSNPFPVNEFP